MKDLIKKINGMFRVCNDMVKTEHSDIEQEKIDNAYNLALTNVLKLLEPEIKCEHDWYSIPNYDENKGFWEICIKCKLWKNNNN
jgi:hypothetical protein